MASKGMDLLSGLKQAEAALAQNIGWSITMNPAEGGHSAQAFGLGGGLEHVDWTQGSPGLASAEMIILGRPFIPVTRPLILPISPGASHYPGPINFGAGIGWSYGEGGGEATFGWDVDSGNWQLKDQVQSPNQGLFELANAHGGISGLLSVQSSACSTPKAASPFTSTVSRRGPCPTATRSKCRAT